MGFVEGVLPLNGEEVLVAAIEHTAARVRRRERLYLLRYVSLSLTGSIFPRRTGKCRTRQQTTENQQKDE